MPIGVEGCFLDLEDGSVVADYEAVLRFVRVLHAHGTEVGEGAELLPLETESRRLAREYEHIEPSIVIVDATNRKGPYDRTLLLLMGQERAKIAVVIDGDNVTFAAAFNSGINFLERFGISGGMPTVLSLMRPKLADALIALGVHADEAMRFRVSA